MLVLRVDKKWVEEDYDNLVKANAVIARDSYWAFRQVMHPDMLKGWFQREVAKELQQFHADLVAGKRPKLILQSPPQHGKSRQIVDLIAWIIGQSPEMRIIYASFSDRLGIRANL